MGEVRIDVGDCVYVFPEQEPPTEKMIEEVYDKIAKVMFEIESDTKLC